MDARTWQDLLWSRDPEFLCEAADLAESLGRLAWADAMRESADDCQSFPSHPTSTPPEAAVTQKAAA